MNLYMDMMKRLSVFDLDNTILDVDSELIWCEILFKRKIVGNAFKDLIREYFADYSAGTMDYPQYEKDLLKPIAGYPEKQLMSLTGEFIEVIKRHIRPQMMDRIDDHKRAGFSILLATASNNIIAEPVAKLLGIENLVCTMAEMNDGIPTGNLIGSPAFGFDKVKKIRNWITESNAAINDSWGYSDSINDLPVLQLVQNPVAVSPDERLRAYALAHGWEIINCQGAKP